MRKYIFLPLALILGILIASCSDNSTNPPAVTEQGSFYLTSTPDSAQIWLNGQNTNKVTPDSVTSLEPNDYTVTLKYNGYRDTSFTVTVVANQQTVKFIQMVSTLSLTTFGPVRIYETANTTASQPSGLVLSSGSAYGVSGANKDSVDIYYSTTGTGGQGYLIQSADLNTTQGLTRHTAFKVGSSNNLNDGVDSPNSALSGWTNYMFDDETNYVFLYDEDGHYSKLIITNSHQGSGQNDPSWVEVKWLYNNNGADQRF
jgi:hypothetical protein